MNPYARSQDEVFRIGESARAGFLRRTYLTLFAAVGGFVLLEIALFQTSVPEAMFQFLAGGRYRWLLFLGGFVVLGGLMSRVALAARSRTTQVLGLAGYVVIEGLIFLPLLLVANSYADGGVIQSAAFVTLAAFAGLTATVFITGQDFSFLRGVVVYGFVIALVAIVAGVLFGFQLGTWFSIGMVGLAGASILYETSNVLHHYPEDRHVAAALSLFASVAIMFYYVLILFLGARD
jgi:hypothetical protein